MTDQALFAYTCVADTAAAIDFYRRAFGATELFRLQEPGGRIGHAELDFDGTTLMAPRDAFYGERSGTIRDPFGHRWNIGHHIEDVSTEEMQRRYTALVGGGADC